MARPMYESQHDLSNEERVAATLGSLWGCQFHKMPIRYHVDWALTKDDRVTAFAELKARNNPIGKYGTFMISLAKWVTGNELSRSANVPFLIVVKWTDGLYWHKTGTAEVEVKMGGRFDRNDSQDFEPVVHIKTENFTRTTRNRSE